MAAKLTAMGSAGLIAEEIKNDYIDDLLHQDQAEKLFFTPSALSQDILGAPKTNNLIRRDPFYLAAIKEIAAYLLTAVAEARELSESSTEELSAAQQEKLIDEINALENMLNENANHAGNRSPDTAQDFRKALSKQQIAIGNAIEEKKQQLERMKANKLASAAFKNDPYGTSQQFADLLKKPETIATLSEKQACAIFAINQLPLPLEDKFAYFSLILQEPKNDAKFSFSNYINEVTEATDYLQCILAKNHDTTSDYPVKNKTKLETIQEQSIRYKTEVFKNCCNYLTVGIKEATPSLALNRFKTAEKEANNIFAKGALSIDRNLKRKTAAIITNIFLHLTGLCLLVNTTHKLLTGNWLLFSKTRSEKRFDDWYKSLRAPSHDGSSTASHSDRANSSVSTKNNSQTSASGKASTLENIEDNITEAESNESNESNSPRY